jgi:hypothetical protein
MTSVKKSCLAALAVLAATATPAVAQAPPREPVVADVPLDDTRALFRPGPAEQIRTTRSTRLAANIQHSAGARRRLRSGRCSAPRAGIGLVQRVQVRVRGLVRRQDRQRRHRQARPRFSTYLITEFLTDRIIANGGGENGAAITAALLSMGFMTFVEVLDGYSVDHGFSGEDMAMNALGASFSRAALDGPGLKEKLDFRLQSSPRRTRFSAALRLHGAALSARPQLAGFEAWSRPPCGISSCRRTTSREASASGKRRFASTGTAGSTSGSGLNFGEILFGRGGPFAGTKAAPYGRRVFEYLQPPFSALTTDNRR